MPLGEMGIKFMIDTTGLPHAKPKRKPDKKAILERLFRAAVWEGDKGICRATGRPLLKVSDNLDECGQVCHLQGRGSHPERATDPTNAILMSSSMHTLSDARGNGRLKLVDPETGAWPLDARKAIRFTLHDKAGNVLWTRVS